MVFIPITPIEPMKFSTGESAQTGRQGAALPFQSVLESAVEELQAAQRVSEEDAYRLALGDVDDLAQVQINAMKTESMVQTTVQLTTRMVNAYKEIMQMQI